MKNGDLKKLHKEFETLITRMANATRELSAALAEFARVNNEFLALLPDEDME